MGSYYFTCDARGETAYEAFRAARDYALYMYGHAGYTGTIAEKHDYEIISEEPHTWAEATDLAKRTMDADDPRVIDKWGPAGCIALVPGESYFFFGYASS